MMNEIDSTNQRYPYLLTYTFFILFEDFQDAYQHCKIAHGTRIEVSPPKHFQLVLYRLRLVLKEVHTFSYHLYYLTSETTNHSSSAVIRHRVHPSSQIKKVFEENFSLSEMIPLVQAVFVKLSRISFGIRSCIKVDDPSAL